MRAGRYAGSDAHQERSQAGWPPARVVWGSLRRWWPLAGATAAVGLIVGLLPPLSVGSAGNGLEGASRSGSCTPGTGAYGCPRAIGGANAGGSKGGTLAGGTGGGSGPLPITAAAGGAGAGGPAGQAVGGTSCGPGVRQVDWTQYSPWCIPQFHGDNGGATSHGVTSSTITLAYREPNSAQQQVVTSFPGADLPDAQYISDMETYIGYFNTQFELYGRKVVLKPYNAQGDYLAEDTGTDTAGAQADAATAYGLGAFADVTFPLFGSTYYWQDLAAQHVVAIGPLALPQSWYVQYAPYEWSVTPTSDELAESVGAVVCRRMAGMDAVFAGSGDYRQQVRRFGLITPDNPLYLQAAGFMEDDIKKDCGLSLAKVASYSQDPSGYASEAINIIAQMKSAGVTTVICGCDPIFPISLTYTADQQSYYPEWMMGDYDDPITRDYAQDQVDHAVGYPGGESAVPSQTQAYKVFETASGGQPPAEPYFWTIYYTLIFLYSGLQAAGPDLTPPGFEAGMFSLPASETGGEAGQWVYGSGIFTPEATYALAWWSPQATSNFDGKQGAWLNCGVGQQYPYSDPSGLGGPGVQLACFH